MNFFIDDPYFGLMGLEKLGSRVSIEPPLNSYIESLQGLSNDFGEIH
jgi:hypothetical protein